MGWHGVTSREDSLNYLGSCVNRATNVGVEFYARARVYVYACMYVCMHARLHTHPPPSSFSPVLPNFLGTNRPQEFLLAAFFEVFGASDGVPGARDGRT